MDIEIKRSRLAISYIKVRTNTATIPLFPVNTAIYREISYIITLIKVLLGLLTSDGLVSYNIIYI